MLSEYGKVLRIIRINNGELLNDMAQKVDVSPALLSYIEKLLSILPEKSAVPLSQSPAVFQSLPPVFSTPEEEGRLISILPDRNPSRSRVT